MLTPDELERRGRNAGGVVLLLLAFASAFLAGRACGLDAGESSPALAPHWR
jgi:hypothetical protein